MYYTKGLIQGFSKTDDEPIITFSFDCLMGETDIKNIIEPIRNYFHTMGAGLTFKMTLESEDV
jgi:hypothetical protein